MLKITCPAPQVGWRAGRLLGALDAAAAVWVAGSGGAGCRGELHGFCPPYPPSLLDQY